jgi:hypothetical protein
MSEVPTFAVVGHPNKGKSSIVATLSRDDSVDIRPEPGTTTRARSFPMRVDDEVLYALVDTPGFERPKQALQWMLDYEARERTTAAEHPRVVARFIEAHRRDERFRSEVELLTPIVGGAGVLYVVDGAVPYGPEYEAEMEVLRWTGQPSMALINPIGSADHVDDWRRALGQYFRIVRVFNAVTAEFDKRVELLRAFAQLNEEWRSPLVRAADLLVADRHHRRQRAARRIAEMLGEMVTHTESKRLAATDDPGPHRGPLEKRYRDRLRTIEREARDAVQEVYDHFTLRRHEGEMELVEADLFSERAWRVFGLTKKNFIAMGAAGGATAGVGLDILSGGFTLGAAALLGGAGGAVGGLIGYLSAQKLSQVRVLNMPAGWKEAVCGPAKNPNLPFVALGRARLHHRLVAGRTHAQRGDLVIDESTLAPELAADARRALQKQFNRLRDNAHKRDVVGEAVDELAELIADLLERDDAPGR